MLDECRLLSLVTKAVQEQLHLVGAIKEGVVHLKCTLAQLELEVCKSDNVKGLQEVARVIWSRWFCPRKLVEIYILYW